MYINQGALKHSLIKPGWLCFLMFLPKLLAGQGSNLPVNSFNYHLLDRLEIKTGTLPPFHSSLKFYTRGDAVSYALSLDSSDYLSYSDRSDLRHFFLDNNEWLGVSALPKVIGEKSDTTSMVVAAKRQSHYEMSKKPLLHYFYRTPGNWYEVDGDYYHLRINPIVNFQLSREFEDKMYYRFINQRGVEIRGGVDDRIFFYSKITDTQASFPDYIGRFISTYHAWPGFTNFKDYTSKVVTVKEAYDNLNAEAYIGFNISKHVGLQLGHSNNFIGNGYRSMLLSNFTGNYFNMKVNWIFGPIRYQNLFAELTAQSRRDIMTDQLLPKKYLAAHYFSVAFSPKFSLGLYEATIFTRDGETGQFELGYLNPVILYRAVEHFIGSPDNVLLGLDVKWNLFRRMQVYGQLLIDEFRSDYFFNEKKGWWGKKYAVQFGAKYVDVFGIDHLDLQAEFNAARPYTYSHYDSIGANYSHYNMPLAHPLGANFRELVLQLRYQPGARWVMNSSLMVHKKGEDGPDQNWGGNILAPNTSREMDFGNYIGQGIKVNSTLFRLGVSFEAFHNVYLDINYFYRESSSTSKMFDDTDSLIGIGFRWNVGTYHIDF